MLTTAVRISVFENVFGLILVKSIRLNFQKNLDIFMIM